ncbi:MAG: hypothetical protein ACLTYW_10500 [Collinsella sp.]
MSWIIHHRPGVQLYTGNWLGDEHAKDDANYGWGAGFALEAEMYPTRRTSRCSRRALWARVTPTAM